jgi:hypothetical protein
MNPLEIIDIKQQQILNTIVNNTYSKAEVKDLIYKSFAIAKQAYMSGEFIFELESFDNEKVTIDNATYKVSKLLGEDSKYTMIVQMLDVPDGDMTLSDIEQLSSVLKKAVHNNPYISGVVLLPPNYDITLMTAKLNTSDYQFPISFSEEDIEQLRGFRSSLHLVDDCYVDDCYDNTRTYISDIQELNYGWIKKKL